MHITISKENLIRGIVTFVVVGGLIWFGIEPFITLLQTYSPFPKEWREFHLVNGEILYGRKSGVTWSEMRIRDVYALERFSEASKSMTADGSEFSLSGELNPTKERYVLVKRASSAHISRDTILYSYPLASDSEVAKYLNVK